MSLRETQREKERVRVVARENNVDLTLSKSVYLRNFRDFCLSVDRVFHFCRLYVYSVTITKPQSIIKQTKTIWKQEVEVECEAVSQKSSKVTNTFYI